MNNLVGHPPDLIGRSDVLDRLVGLVKEHEVVTVTGVGGVGKTVLAISAGHRALEDFDEVWFVPLSRVVTPAAVNASIAKATGIAGSPSYLADIADALARRGRMLIIADNCEHVVDATAAMADALRHLDNVTVLATSRVDLEVVGEQILRLGPLGPRDDAVELFVREARRRDPDFEASGPNRQLVEEICAAVDGIPLAVELAGAATRSMGLAELLDRLGEILATARPRQRGDPRHATMAAAIEWSIGLLEPDIAAALGACTVFGGTFDLLAAEAVLPAATNTSQRVAIDELVAQSLVETVSIGDGVRYRLLEPVRQYAATALSTDFAAARHGHLEHYLARLEDAYEQFCTTSCEPLLGIILHDIDNLRVVHEWALETGRIDDDLRLYRPLGAALLHSIHDPADWAIDTIWAANLDGRRGAAAAFRLATRATLERDHVSSLLGELIERHRQLVPHLDDDDIRTAARASAARYRGDYERAVEIWRTVESDDPIVAMSRFHEGAFALGACADVPATAVADWLADEAAWIDSIGARNLRAARLGFLGYMEVTFGDPQQAYDLVDEAHALALSMNMHDRSLTFRVDRVRAMLLGATGPIDLHEELRDALRESAHLRVGICVRFALDVAARVLAGSADAHVVELCDAFGYVALAWGDKPDPSPPEIDAARVERDHGGVSVYDVAELAADALDTIIATRATQRHPRVPRRPAQIRLLGPVAVVNDVQVVGIGGERQRRLLAALAVASPEAVSVDRLVDIVWQGAPPPSAAKTLRVYVSRLRSALVTADLGDRDGVIGRVGSGYLLDVERGRIDIDQFEDACRAVDALREARAHGDVLAAIDRTLGLWHGPPLMSFAEEGWARGTAERLTQMRITLLEHRVEALLGSGHPAVAVGAVEALVNEHPLRERPRSLHMRSLDAAGRRPEALRSYQDFHRLLGEELGLRPSAELRALESGISSDSSSDSQDPTSDVMSDVVSSGEHRLREKSESEVIRHLDPRVGDVDFGRLATGGLAATNLVGRPRALIGREDDLRELDGLLAAHGLVTVTGVGGVGKTSIATAVAHEWSRRVEEVWFVELAPVSDPSVVASRLSKTVGIAGAPSDVAEICAVLDRRGSLLVVLDNCEHVLEAAADLVVGLMGVDDVTVLATSRLEMEIPGEQVLRLGPLGVSDRSVELFVREARRRAPGFEASEGERDAIEAICEAVDGIPLAIELAAAKTRSIDVVQILERLDSVLGTSTRRTRAGDRHATMTAAIDWSIDILESTSARVLGVLTVFAGTFDLAAVSDVLARLGVDVDALGEVDELVAHSLLEPVRTEIGVRYRVLEPVRQRAQETLLFDPDAACHAHLDHYLDRLENAYEIFGTSSCDPILQLLFHDLDNLRALHNWALETDRIEDDLRLYRPLRFATWHQIYDPSGWAAEAWGRQDVRAHQRGFVALEAAIWGSKMRSGTTTLIRHVDAIPDNDQTESFLRLVEVMQMAPDDAGRPALVRSVRRDDLCTRFILAFEVPLTMSTFGSHDEALEEAIRGVLWTEAIGARNLGASLHATVMDVAILGGQLPLALEHARKAADLALETRMWFNHIQATSTQVELELALGRPSADATDTCIEALERSVDAGSALAAAYGLRAAAALLRWAGRSASAVAAEAATGRIFRRTRLGDHSATVGRRDPVRVTEGQLSSILDAAHHALAELSEIRSTI